MVVLPVPPRDGSLDEPWPTPLGGDRPQESAGWFYFSQPTFSGSSTIQPEFWARKRQMNMERDARNHSELQELGWSVLDVWECELEDTDVVLSKLTTFLGGEPGARLGRRR